MIFLGFLERFCEYVFTEIKKQSTARKYRELISFLFQK
jgi:hypothetical protein